MNNDTANEMTAPQSEMQRQTFSCAYFKNLAKQHLKGKWLVAICFLLPIAIIEYGSFFLRGNYSFLTPFFIGFVYMGQSAIALAVVHGRKPTMADALSGFTHFWRTLFATLLFYLYTFLWSMVLVIPGWVVFMIIVCRSIIQEHPMISSSQELQQIIQTHPYIVENSKWLALLCFFGIIRAISYSATFYLLNEYPNLHANEAITKSRKLLDGHKWELVKLFLSFIGWLLLVIVTFGIAVFYVEPFYEVTFGEFFAKLIKDDKTRNTNESFEPK